MEYGFCYDYVDYSAFVEDMTKEDTLEKYYSQELYRCAIEYEYFKNLFKGVIG